MQTRLFLFGQYLQHMRYFVVSIHNMSSEIDVITIDDDYDMVPTTSVQADAFDYMSKLPDDLIWKILSWLCDDAPWIARLSRFVCLFCLIF